MVFLNPERVKQKGGQNQLCEKPPENSFLKEKLEEKTEGKNLARIFGNWGHVRKAQRASPKPPKTATQEAPASQNQPRSLVQPKGPILGLLGRTSQATKMQPRRHQEAGIEPRRPQEFRIKPKRPQCPYLRTLERDAPGARPGPA